MLASLWSSLAPAIVPLASAAVGGLIVVGRDVVVELLAERRQRTAEYQNRSREDAAILTGAFAIRNFIGEQINAYDDGNADGVDLQSLKAAQDSLQRLIDKASPNTELLMLSLFEVQLRLTDLLGVLEHNPAPLSNRFRLIRKANALLAALRTLDLHLHNQLGFVSLDDFEELTDVDSDEETPRAA